MAVVVAVVVADSRRFWRTSELSSSPTECEVGSRDDDVSLEGSMMGASLIVGTRRLDSAECDERQVSTICFDIN